jgi:hypothetical protein
MKRTCLIVWLVAIAMLVSASAEAQWVFVARKAMGRIRQMQGGHADVAAVMLDAAADEVYGKALSTIEAGRGLKVTKKDGASRTVAFSDGERKAMLQVEELNEGVSEILISASPAEGGQGTGSLVVERIMEICKEVKVECRPAKQ